MNKENLHSVVLLDDSFLPIIDGVCNVVSNYQIIFTDKYKIYSPVITPKQKNFDYKNYKYPIFPLKTVNTIKIFGYITGIPFSPKTIKILKKNPPQLIHVHTPFTALTFALVLRNIFKCPIIFTYHTKFDIELRKRLKGKLFYKVAHRYMINHINSVDQIWAVNESVKKDLILNGCGDINTITMENGTDMSGKNIDKDIIKKYTSPYLYNDNRLVLLFVGRHFWVKGFKITLDCLKKLKENNIKFTFISIGDGLEKKQIINYAIELGLNDEDVKFIDSITNKDELKSFYTVADLFLLPSTYDTSGLVVIEAAANKTPSILIKNSDASSNKTDEVDCFLIEENPDSMYKLIAKLDKNRELIKKVSLNAYKNIYVSWDEKIKDVLPRYTDAIEIYKKKKIKIHHNIFLILGIKFISFIMNLFSYFVILKKK